jgi:RimJ/RimL family protein N-acetyltransferase
MPCAVQTRFTERLSLVPVGLEHADDLLTLHQDPGIARWYGVFDHHRARERAAEFARGWQVHGLGKWMAYDRMTGALVGRGGLSLVPVHGREQIEVGWIVREPLWGNGYATEIGRAALHFAFADLAVAEVVAFTEVANERSVAVMQRLGMHFVEHFDADDGVTCVLYATQA